MPPRSYDFLLLFRSRKNATNTGERTSVQSYDPWRRFDILITLFHATFSMDCITPVRPGPRKEALNRLMLCFSLEERERA